MATKKIKAFKAFNHDMTCRDFQYEVGKSYTHKGEVSACNSGFHACKEPFAVWEYYSPTDDKGNLRRYAEVE